MGRPIEITRFDLTATELRELAAKTQDGAVVRRRIHPARDAWAHLNRRASFQSV